MIELKSVPLGRRLKKGRYIGENPSWGVSGESHVLPRKRSPLASWRVAGASMSARESRDSTLLIRFIDRRKTSPVAIGFPTTLLARAIA